MNILFVCSGNVSRSFLAEILLTNELEKARVGDIAVASAGVHAYPGSPPDPEMVDYVLKMGILVGHHEARRITGKEVAWADMILVMEERQEKLLKQTWPEAENKVNHLGKFLTKTGDADDIVDPYRKNQYHYRLAQSQITLSVKELAAYLLSKKNRDNL